MWMITDLIVILELITINNILYLCAISTVEKSNTVKLDKCFNKTRAIQLNCISWKILNCVCQLAEWVCSQNTEGTFTKYRPLRALHVWEQIFILHRRMTTGPSGSTLSQRSQ